MNSGNQRNIGRGHRKLLRFDLRYRPGGRNHRQQTAQRNRLKEFPDHQIVSSQCSIPRLPGSEGLPVLQP